MRPFGSSIKCLNEPEANLCCSSRFYFFFFSPQSTVQILSSIRMVVQKAGSEAENGPNEGDTSHVWNWAAIPVLRFLS